MKNQKPFATHEKMLDKYIGKEGTSEREAYNMRIELALVGHKVKELREAKNYTQKQLGELIGVQSAQICKIEKGQNLSLANVSRIFKALGVDVQLIIGKQIDIVSRNTKKTAVF
jgi:DNA-binding XRE family transcriptional regulator